MDVFSFLGGMKPGMMMAYGKAGSGKTTMALQMALAQAHEGKKVLFLDTEGGFSLERFQQMAGERWASSLDHITLMSISGFDEQYQRITTFAPLVQRFGLVILDTVGRWYRQELKKDALVANRIMDRQLRLLFEMARKMPVLLTNQVYDNIATNTTASVGGAMVLKWCHTIIELRKEPREILMKKPEENRASFTIADQGILLS